MSRNESCMSGATHRMPQELSKWLFKRDIIAFLFSRAHKKMAYQAFSSPCRVCFSEALFKEASIVTLDVIRRNHIVTFVLSTLMWLSCQVLFFLTRSTIYDSD